MSEERLERLEHWQERADERFDRIDAWQRQADEKFERIDVWQQRADERFDRIDRRFNDVDSRFDAVDARFDGIDARFEAVDARFEAVDARFDTVDAQFKAVAASIHELGRYMRLLHEDVVGRIADSREVPSDHADMAASLDSLGRRLDPIEALVPVVREHSATLRRHDGEIAKLRRKRRQ